MLVRRAYSIPRGMYISVLYQVMGPTYSSKKKCMKCEKHAAWSITHFHVQRRLRIYRVLLPVLYIYKAVPLQVWSGPEGSRKLTFPDFMTTAQDGVKLVSLTHRPPLSPGNAPGSNFCYRLS